MCVFDKKQAAYVGVLLMVLLMAACGRKPMLEVAFALPEAAEQQRVEFLAFYISNPYFILKDGQKLPAVLDDTKPWQSNTVALIKLHCRSENCGRQLVLKPPRTEAHNIQGVGFDMGVPFEQNHSNPLLAPAPLNDDAMFWVWQQGHKFLRLDLSNTASQGGVVFHIGSVGCAASSVMRAPSSACTQPNILALEFPVFDVNENKLEFQLASFGAPAGNEVLHCTGDYAAKLDCAALFSQLGMSLSEGRCDPVCNAGYLFSVVQRGIND